MTSSTARTIQRRDAAVTSALVGAVLVILGYASGIGLKPQSAVTASLTEPHTPATTAPQDQAQDEAPGDTPAPPQPVDIAPAAAGPVLGSGTVSAHVSSPTTPPGPPATPSATPSSAGPTADAAPEPSPGVPCAAGPVDGLLGGLPLLSDVTSLVQGLLGTPLLTPTTPTTPADPALGTCPTAARVPAAGVQ